MGGMRTWKARRLKKKFIRLALAEFPKERVKEYIDEGEHQDGFEYWLNFLDADEAFDDLKRYWVMSDKMDAALKTPKKF